MPEDCLRYAGRLDAWVDGEDVDPGLEAHVSGCASCRSEVDARAALKRALSTLVLPAPPRAFDRALLAPPRRAWWPATAAAAALAAVFLLSLPGSVGNVVAQSVRLHEEVLAGRLVLRDLGLKRTATRADIPTGCPCPPDLGASSPFVVYGRGDSAVSCLALDDPRPRPSAWHRLGRNTVLVRSHRGLLEIWISHRSRDSLSAWLQARDSDPEPGSLQEFTCRACCELLESRARGGPEMTLDLVVAGDGGRVDPDRLVGDLRPAGKHE